jgi:hypothetical protein
LYRRSDEAATTTSVAAVEVVVAMYVALSLADSTCSISISTDVSCADKKSTSTVDVIGSIATTGSAVLL